MVDDKDFLKVMLKFLKWIPIGVKIQKIRKSKI